MIVIGTNNQPEGLGSSSGFAADLLVEILELNGYTIEFQTFDSWEEETAALASNNVDVLLDMISDGPFLYSETYHSVHTDELFYAVAIGEYQLANEINQGLKELQDNGTYRELFIKYFGEENFESNL